jgi:GT2 family glycosyltransferase
LTPSHGLLRPAVDVVVPFVGDDSELDALLRRLATLALGPDDTLVVVDNRPGRSTSVQRPNVVRAPARQSSYHARNVGAARGHAPWLLFLDGDVQAPPDIVDRYFATPVGERVAVLAGAIKDLPPAARRSPAERYAHLSTPLSDDNTWRPGFEYAQTASAAVRRAAFEQCGGFAEVRSGGDADICYRLMRAGWMVERRPDAVVGHRSRASTRGLVRQYLRYGAGAAWLEARYPGFAPRSGWGEMLVDFLRGQRAATLALRRGDPDRAVTSAVGALCRLAFGAGACLSNGAHDRVR